jgi:hypothetical protein
MSPFATAALSPIKRETSSPVAIFQPFNAHFLSPQLQSQSEVQDSADSEQASTLLLFQFSQQPATSVEQPRETETSVTMDVDATIMMNETVTSTIEKECTTQPPLSLNNEEIVEKESEEQDGNTSKSFVLEYSLEHDRDPLESCSVSVDESTSPALALIRSKCYKVRIVYDESPAPPPRGILRRRLRYTKSDGNEVEMEKEQDSKTEHEELDELDDTYSHGITLPELKQRMAILFPTDYSQLIQSVRSCCD